MERDGFHGRSDRLSYLLAVENGRRLLADPSLAERASDYLERFTSDDPHQVRAYRLWRDLLDGPLQTLVTALTERSERGDYVRQTAPPFEGLSASLRHDLVRRSRHPLNDDASTSSAVT